jgi:hypothetical protein
MSHQAVGRYTDMADHPENHDYAAATIGLIFQLHRCFTDMCGHYEYEDLPDIKKGGRLYDENAELACRLDQLYGELETLVDDANNLVRQLRGAAH